MLRLILSYCRRRNNDRHERNTWWPSYNRKNVHVGAGAVLAGVIEPPSASPVVIEDNVLIGANAVILEGVRVGAGAIVAAGAIVTQDVPAGAVVAGTPAKVIKQTSEVQDSKREIVSALRKLNNE